jgi:phosphate acetyltransferase
MVAGDAYIVLVRDFEAGNMLAKEMSFLADANRASIVPGARVPVILTSRAERANRMASRAVAALYVHARRVKVSGGARGIAFSEKRRILSERQP